jgi:hypothetical protein
MIERKFRLDRRRQLVGEWDPKESIDRSENELFDKAFDLAESALALDRVAGTRKSGRATAAAMGAISSALGSQATAVLRIRSLADYELGKIASGNGEVGELEKLGRILHAVEQNLRFAQEAADLARQAAAEILDAEDHR